MKILITGGNGQLGWALAQAFRSSAEIILPDRATMDLANPDQIVSCLREMKPDLILNAGAYTAVDRAESEAEIAFAINAQAPGILADEANRLGVPLVHYSTDYVFDGTATRPYEEEELTNPLSVYGRSKRDGEIAVRAVAERYVTLRVSWLYGNRRQNFLQTMLRLARERDTLSVVNDQWGAPTWVQSIADVTKRIVVTDTARADISIENGTYHVAAQGKTSWYEFACALLAQTHDPMRRASEIKAIPTAEYKTPAKRPAYSVLNCAKISQATGLSLASWQTQLSNCLAEREPSVVS
jgi:dTDP-4-dehydrorhamnose reductase